MFPTKLHRTIFTTGTAIVLVCFLGLIATDDPAWTKLLDNVHWTAAYLTAAILTFLTWRKLKGPAKSVLGWFAIGTAGYSIGQFLWDIQVYSGWNPFPGPSDAFFLMLAPTFALGAAALLRQRVQGSRFVSVVLDAAILIVASLSLTLALYLPKRGNTDLLQLLVMIAYPVCFVAATSLLFLAILYFRPKPHPSWPLVLTALLVDSAIWMAWNSQTLDGTLADGTLYNALFSIASLALGLGCSTWEFEPSLQRSGVRFRDIFLRLLPMIAVVIACIAIIICLTATHLSPVISTSIQYGALAILVLSIIRQTLTVTEIQARETRYELAVRGSMVGLWDWDFETDNVYYSDWMRELLGYSEEEFPNHLDSFNKVLHPDDSDRVWAAVEHHLLEGAPYDVVFRMETKERGLRWFCGRGQAVKNVQGKPYRMSGSITDIHDETLTKQEVQRLSRLQKAILDNAGYAIIATDPQGTITAFNPTAERMLGYSAEEMIGKQNPGVFHDPKEIELRRAEFSTKLGQPIIGDFQVFVAEAEAGYASVHKWTYIRKDGTHFPVLLSVTRLSSSGGLTEGYLGVAADITEQQTTERALRESEAKFSQIFHSVPDMLALQRASDLAFIDVNPSFESITGFTKAEVIGRSSADFGIWDDPAQRNEMVRLLTTNGFLLNFEGQMRMKSGERRTVLLSITPIIIGQEPYLLSVGRDMTEAKDAERQILQLNQELEQRVKERTQELEASNAELESFAYSVSHDLRAPLRGIEGFTSLLEESIEPRISRDQRMYAARVRSATQRMGEIIDSLLDLSRVSRNNMMIEPVNLSNIARDWVLEHGSEEQNRTLEWIIHDTPTINADRRLLETLMDNLFSNAHKYTRTQPDTKIEFGCINDEPRSPLFFIQDNGAGFNMAYADRIFRPFQRLHRIDEFEGTGIGLATVYRIIQRHGGWIKAESEVGNGARFTFCLPTTKNQI